MNNKGRFALILGLIWWVTGWICIGWVLNYAVYQGMSELWLIQTPFTAIDVVKVHGKPTSYPSYKYTEPCFC